MTKKQLEEFFVFLSKTKEYSEEGVTIERADFAGIEERKLFGAWRAVTGRNEICVILKKIIADKRRPVVDRKKASAGDRS